MRVLEYIKKRSVKHGLFFLFLLLLGFLFYGKTLSVGFLSDDWHALLVAKETDNIFRFFTTNIVGSREGSSYGPMWNMVTFMQYHLFGMQAVWYHMVSIVLMSGTAFVLFGLVRRLFHKDRIAYGAAVLFVIAPSHVETVAWVAGQPHLFATFFYVLALYWYVIFSSQKKPLYYLLAFGSIMLSLLTKEIAIPFFVSFFLIDIWFNRISIQKGYRKSSLLHLLKWYVPLVLAVGGYLFARQYATGVLAGYYGSETIAVSLRDVVQMATQLTVGLFLSYPIRDGVAIWALADKQTALLILAGFVASLAFVCRKYAKQVGFAIALYLVSLVPYVTLHYSSHGNEGERYTYLPSVFAAIVIAYVLYCVARHISSARAVYVVLLAFLTGMSWVAVQEKNSHWVLAGSIVQETMTSIGRLPLDNQKPIIFVGLPDQIEGAQLFRNGTFEALRLLGYGEYTGGRVLISPLVFPTYQKTQPLVMVKNCEDQTAETLCFSAAQSVDRLFTGLPQQTVGETTFVLEDFRRTDHTGTRIRVEGYFADKQLVYFNHNSFQLYAP